jgi:hypothetical protein
MTRYPNFRRDACRGYAPHLPAPDQVLPRLRDFLRVLTNGGGTPEYRRREALVLLQGLDLLGLPDGAPRGNIEPEEGLLKTPHPEE